MYFHLQAARISVTFYKIMPESLSIPAAFEISIFNIFKASIDVSLSWKDYLTKSLELYWRLNSKLYILGELESLI